MNEGREDRDGLSGSEDFEVELTVPPSIDVAGPGSRSGSESLPVPVRPQAVRGRGAGTGRSDRRLSGPGDPGLI